MQPFASIFLSCRGRIRRRTYYWSAFLLVLTFCVLFSFLETNVSRASTLILYPPLLWCAFALASKRLHDREQSAWWLVLLIVPVLGPIVVAAWLLLGRGTRDENRFGPDPRTAGADYLTVRLGK